MMMTKKVMMMMAMMAVMGEEVYKRRSVPTNSFQLPPIDEPVWSCH